MRLTWILVREGKGKGGKETWENYIMKKKKELKRKMKKKKKKDKKKIK